MWLRAYTASGSSKNSPWNWTNAIAGDLEFLGYVSEIHKEREFYRRYVSPNLSKGSRVFVVISDALRFEVATELSEVLSHATKGKAALGGDASRVSQHYEVRHGCSASGKRADRISFRSLWKNCSDGRKDRTFTVLTSVNLDQF